MTQGRAGQQPPPVRTLFVCMGNICRSPIAEGVFHSRAAELAPHRCLEADSAGTHGYHAGQPPDARAQLVARGHGLDISGLRARQLGREDFDQFDWILVMDQRNYSDVLLVAPAGAQERVRLLLDFVPDLKSKEVPDPYYGRVSDFELAYDLIDRAVCSLLTTF